MVDFTEYTVFEQEVFDSIICWIVNVRDPEYYARLSNPYVVAQEQAYNRSIVREYWDEQFKNYGMAKAIYPVTRETGLTTGSYYYTKWVESNVIPRSFDVIE